MLPVSGFDCGLTRLRNGAQLGEQADEALARLSAAHAKLQAAEKRLESLGVDAVSLQVCASE